MGDYGDAFNRNDNSPAAVQARTKAQNRAKCHATEAGISPITNLASVKKLGFLLVILFVVIFANSSNPKLIFRYACMYDNSQSQIHKINNLLANGI